ncbi:MAG: ankyrin repeat domain-containing protein [Candidatus Hydrogenedens sp.]
MVKLYRKIKNFIYLLPLIITGCNPSCFDLAAKGDVVNLEKQLLKNPAIINSKDYLGKTMLHYAVCSGSKDILDLLYIYGAKLDEKDITGMTPLHVCAMWDLKGPARWLITHGSDTQIKDNFGDSPLHTSAIFGTVNVGKYLKTIGIPMEERNNEGMTPKELAKKHRNNRWIEEIAGN